MKDKQIAALTKCYFCGEDNEILLSKHLSDMSEYHGKVCSMEPCNKCTEYMEKGIILIGIDSQKSDPDWNKSSFPNPYRTGHFAVITEEGFKRIFTAGDAVDFGLKNRFMFVEGCIFEELGIRPK